MDLPAEILLQILCQSYYIRRVLQLSSTCTLIRQLWLDNTAVIARAVFELSRAELLEILQIVRLEAPSTPDQELQREVLHKGQDQGVSEQALNAAVRQHIQFLASIY
jgi:hypothetical protein